MDVSFPPLPKEGWGLSVTLKAVRVFITIRNVGNCHYESCKKLQENEIIHISASLISKNPTVKRQEMKPGNKFQSCSCKSKFIFLPERNSISLLPCMCVHRHVRSVCAVNTTLQHGQHVGHSGAHVKSDVFVWKNRKRRTHLLTMHVYQVHFQWRVFIWQWLLQ